MTRRARTTRRLLLPIVVGTAVLPWLGVASASATPAGCPAAASGDVSGVSYTVDGAPVAALAGHTHSGALVGVTFTASPSCHDLVISLATYSAPDGLGHAQHLSDSASGTFNGGSHTLTARIPAAGAYQVDVIGGAPVDPLGAGYYGSHHLLIAAASGAGKSVAAGKPPVVVPPPTRVPPTRRPPVAVPVVTSANRPPAVVAPAIAVHPQVAAATAVRAAKASSLPFTGADSKGLAEDGLGLLGAGALALSGAALLARRARRA